MIELRVICDRCKSEITTDPTFLTLPTRLIRYKDDPLKPFFNGERQADLCQPCRDDFDLWLKQMGGDESTVVEVAFTVESLANRLPPDKGTRR